VEGKIRDYKDLILWRKSVELAKVAYRITRTFPNEDRFGLTAQLRRAVVSVASNIAEGHTRRGREFAHFLSISRGSLAEVECQLILAEELGLKPRGELSEGRELIVEIRRMAVALANKLACPKA
jgi:four helix bundle protein